MSAHREIDLARVRTTPLATRPSKVATEAFGRPVRAGASVRDLLDALPDVLAAADLRRAASEIARRHRRGGAIWLGLGAHPIKVGLSPWIVDWLDRGVLAGIALNGAGIIHDFEVALVGRTSEDVAARLDDGSFGMAEETGRILNEAITAGAARGLGLGEAVGHAILDGGYPNADRSLLATAARCGIPATVHVGIGTDIIHMHPAADGAAIGATSLRDFRILAAAACRLEGGAYVNLGSAVILPEVFLKALNLARNTGHVVDDLLTLDLDFQRHYRPRVNVVERPTRRGGIGLAITGHHEILFPLLCAAVEENLAAGPVD